jgi:2-phosphosulfolactate phosphatase
VEGAASARGTALVIDVIRAFTVSAYALAGGARCCRLVRGIDEARRLAASIPGSLLSAESEGLPIDGIPISNSPTQITGADLRGRTLVQRTSSGTQAAVAAGGADRLLVTSLVVASATARMVLAEAPEVVTIVPSRPDHEEDRACAAYLQALLTGRVPDAAALLAPLRASPRYRRLAAGEVAGFPPTDLDLALDVDRFDFAMPAALDGTGLCVEAVSA